MSYFSLYDGPGDVKDTSDKVAKLLEGSLSQINGTVGALGASIVNSDDNALATGGDLDFLATPGALFGHVTVLRSILR
jgi:hypothetical protein